jgi:hypothetical protein
MVSALVARPSPLCMLFLCPSNPTGGRLAGKCQSYLDMTYPREGGERGQGMLSYLRCSVGVPGLEARVGEWVSGGLRGMSD